MKLTAILSNFNHAKYLPLALDALLAQTRPPDELIVIDDASTDNSVEIIENYLLGQPRIRFLRNTDNLGIVSNMNRGLEIASGDIVYFAAADDVAYPLLFETGMGLLEAYPNAALFSARCEIIDRHGRRKETFPTPTPLSESGFIGPDRAIKELLRDDGWFVGGTTLYRRSMLIAAGGFLSELGAFCDGYVSRLLALKHGSCYAPAVLGGWRRMEGGVAWAQATNLSSMSNVIKIAEQRMHETKGIFPPNYIRRWKGRHVFGARRFSMIQERKNARREGAILYLLAGMREICLTGWLFCYLRPWDLLTVLRRRWRILMLNRS